MTDNKAEKRCSHCKKNKPLSEFGVNRAMKDGINYRCRGCIREYIKKYHKTSLWKKSHKKNQRKYNKTEIGSENVRKYTRRYRAKYPDRVAARVEVAKAIKRGDIESPANFKCVSCSKKRAKHYHHHKGYAKKHWLDVVPVCRQCHGKLDLPEHRTGGQSSNLGRTGQRK